MKKNVVIMSAILLVIAFFTVSCATGGKTEQRAKPVIKYSWDFEDPAAGTEGWYLVPDEYWDFHGTAELSRDDKTFGKGLLRLDVDFTNDTQSEWSEPKMMMQFDPPLVGLRKFTFDIIYNPEFASYLVLKSKVIIRNDDKDELATYVSDAVLGFDDYENGYVMETISLPVRTVEPPITNMLLSIAGYKSDYKGPIFFDNMRWE